MAYVERQRGGRQRVPMGERNECSGWTRVCELADIEPGRGVVRVVNGAEIAVMRDGDRVFALGNLCPHRGGQIGDGHVEDGKAICPLHGWDFDLQTGISPVQPGRLAPDLPGSGARRRGRDRRRTGTRGARPARRCTWGRGRGAARPIAACTWCTTWPRAAGRSSRRWARSETSRACTPAPTRPTTSWCSGRRSSTGCRCWATSRWTPRWCSARAPRSRCTSTSRCSSATCPTGRSAPRPRRRWRGARPPPAPRSQAVRAEPTRASATTPSATSSRWRRATSAGTRRTSQPPARSRSRSARARSRGSAARCWARR